MGEAGLRSEPIQEKTGPLGILEAVEQDFSYPAHRLSNDYVDGLEFILSPCMSIYCIVLIKYSFKNLDKIYTLIIIGVNLK